MLRLDLQDGTSLGITDHDQPCRMNLGDGAISYSASTGILASDVVLTCGLKRTITRSPGRLATW
jgi:hypothetical protein